MNITATFVRFGLPAAAGLAVAVCGSLWLGGLLLAGVLVAGPSGGTAQEIVIRNASGSPVQPVAAEFDGRPVAFAVDAVLLAGGKRNYAETRLVRAQAGDTAALVLRYRPLAGEGVEEFRATVTRAADGNACPFVIVLEAQGPRAAGCERLAVAALPQPALPRPALN